jgi:WD40 repeat protein
MTSEKATVADTTKIELVSEFKHLRPLTSCIWDPQGRYVFFGAEDNFVHRYDTKEKASISLAAHDSWVRAMAVSSKHNQLVTGGYDGRLVWWNATAEKPEAIRKVDAHQGWIRALAISPDHSTIATCGNDLLVKLWSIEDGKLIHELQGHQSHVYNVAFTIDGLSLVSFDLKGYLKAWDVKSDFAVRDIAKVEALHKYDPTFRADIGGARSIAFKPDGELLAIGGITNVTNAFAGLGDIAVALVDWKQGKVVQLLEAKEKTRGLAWGIAYHPQGHWIGLAGGGGGGWLYFWKGNETNEFFKLKLKNDGRGLSLADDHQRLAIAHADAYLRIYSLGI